MDDVEKLQVSVRIKLDSKDAQARIDWLQARIDNLKKSVELKQNTIDIDTKLANTKLGIMQEKLSEMKDRFASIRKETDKPWFDKAFKSALDNAKKLAYSLLTVRGVWFAIRKAMTTYLSQNEELQTRLNAVYYGVGSLFAPILEMLVTQLEYMLALIDRIVKKLGMAGIDMTKFGKATQKAKAQLLGFDEINNLYSKQGSDSYKIKELQDLELSFHKIAGTLGLIVGTILALRMLKDLPILDFENLEAWATAVNKMVGIPLIIIGITTAFGSLLDYLNDPTWTHFGEIISSLGLALAGFGITVGSWPLILAGAMVIGIGVLMANWDKITEWWEEKKGEFPKWVQIVGDDVIKTLDVIFTEIKDWFDSLIEMINKKDVGGAILAAFGLKNNNNGLFSGNFTLGGFWDNFKSFFGFRSYDVGTSYVPNDQLAMVHKGEAIIPAKYNNADLYGNVSAEQLNLLSGIYEMVENINRKEFDVSLDGQSMTQKIRTINDQQVARNGGQAFAIAR